MTNRNQIHDHQSIMNLLHENDMNTTTMFYGGEPERSETLIQNGNKGYRFQGAQILFSVTTPHSRDPNQIQTTKLSDLRTPSSSENQLGEQPLTDQTRGTNYTRNGITTPAWHDQARRNSAQKIKGSNRAGSGFEAHQISRNCRGISLGEGGHPHHRRSETAISLSLPAGGRGGDARCLRVVCVSRGEARPQLLKYPATQTHRIRSTPPPSKNNRAVSRGVKKVTASRLVRNQSK